MRSSDWSSDVCSSDLFRANISEPGSNELADGFDRDKVSNDGVNFSDLETWGGSARLRWDLGRVNLYSITGYETVESLNRGDIDGGYGAVFLPDSGPGLIPFASESADGMPDHRQVSQEFRLESAEWGRFDWQAGLFWYDERSEEHTSALQSLMRSSYAVFCLKKQKVHGVLCPLPQRPHRRRTALQTADGSDLQATIGT